MASCTDFEPLLAERAAGPLAPDDERRLDFHLATCARCRAELAAYERTFGLARLPPPSAAELQSLTRLPAVLRADVERAPIGKALGRILTLAAVAAAIVVVVANKVVLPAARRNTVAPAPVAATGWKEPDVAALFERVERENPELAIRAEVQLTRAEQLADAAYLKAYTSEP